MSLFQNPSYDEGASTAKAFGDALSKFGAKYRNVVVLDANAGRFLNLGAFARAFPDRYFNFGNAESNMITAAAGFSVRGKVPFVCSFSMFITGRAWEQVRNALCYPNLNVKLVGAYSGILCGEDGATYQALEDIAITRALPNMKVICPADMTETRHAVEAAINDFGPTYMRLANKISPPLYDESYKFAIGKGHIYKAGTSVCIFSCGNTLHSSLETASMLERDGISTMVVNLSSIKPIDANLIVECSKQAQQVVTVEDHQIVGGLGSAVAEVLSVYYPVKVLRIGMDGFGESGKTADLYRKYRLDATGIYEQIKAAA